MKVSVLISVHQWFSNNTKHQGPTPWPAPPYGIRSLSKYHEARPFSLRVGEDHHEINYCAGDSDTPLFGGNSNWRGPVWFPLNYLLVEALKRYGRYYGEEFKVEYPTGSGNTQTLLECAADIEGRLTSLFLKNADGRRPYNHAYPYLDENPHFADYHQFFEFFNPDTGQGHGASHQTGWTALVATLLENRK